MTKTIGDADTLREANAAVARRWMTTLNEPAWWDLLDDNIVLEFPYGPSLGMAERHVGKRAVIAYCRGLFARLGTLKFQDLQITGTTDPNVFYSEYYADLATPSGENYRQTYINKLKIHDGKVVLMREFWDPKRIVDAANGNFAFNT